MADNDDAVNTQPVSEGQEADLTPPMGEEPLQASNEPVDQPQEPSNNEANEGAEAPEPVEEEEPDDEYTDTSQYYRSANSELPVNEDGTVDPIKFREQIKQELREEMRFNQQEQRTWSAIEKKYPQLRQDKDTREILLNQRIANAVTGKETNLVKLADKLYSREKAAETKGRAEAKTSTRVQQAASLESNSSNTGNTDKTSDKLDRISRGDKQAATDLLSEWLDAGII